ncbi:MAG: D-fructose-6-phosphate amidotransferase [Dehalococcoidia bacterium]|nr:D-fructose-6-phosphate amidotransferase [Dehalococcoidia bacterium]|tara:strand:+ start:586 stop:876 length:291 start_codon:yes stop_codon:yes gene_type:complete
MRTYAIAEVDVSNAEMFRRYMELVPKTVDQFGGKYLVRGGTVKSIEGDWHPKRLVVIEFESMDEAIRWYNSKEYSEVLKIRHISSDTKLVFVEGIM